jgi:ABC-type cobalamin/Fe3+-siderophores transport system ATPase subunit
MGLNGCGKSTLLKTLAGFLPPVSGRLRWQGKRPVIGSSTAPMRRRVSPLRPRSSDTPGHAP